MKSRISFFVIAGVIALTLFSFRMPERAPEEVFTCPVEFGIAHNNNGGCISYYPTGTNYSNFNWIGWEVFYSAGGSNLFKTFGPTFETQTFGSLSCDEPAVMYVRAKSMRVCDGVAHLSDWVYYSID